MTLVVVLLRIVEVLLESRDAMVLIPACGRVGVLTKSSSIELQDWL